MEMNKGGGTRLLECGRAYFTTLNFTMFVRATVLIGTPRWRYMVKVTEISLDNVTVPR